MKLLNLSLLISFLVIFGCANHFYKGQLNLAQHLESYKSDEKLYKIIELKNIKIIIVGSKQNYKNELMQLRKPAGYCIVLKNEIYLIGKRTKNNKIIINQFVLGHELMHLLNFNDQKITNPDEIN